MSTAARRALAAPFQPRNSVSETASAPTRPVVQPLPIQLVSSSLPTPYSPRFSPRFESPVDFRSHTFKPLAPYEELSLEEYCGPTTESNWVIPGVLLVGAYPATQDDEETVDLITSILRLGIKKFVCLQQEYRAGVPREIWRAGLALRPYFEDVESIVASKTRYPQLAGCPVVDKTALSFVHCPIVDCDITDDSTVLKLARKLVEDISRGDVIYLHCWGGHGRTGTVVSIMLHLMYGISAMEAMRRCQAVHDLRKCPVEVGSPQTQTQRDQVVRVVSKLIASYKSDSRPSVMSQLSLQVNGFLSMEQQGSGTPRKRSDSLQTQTFTHTHTHTTSTSTSTTVSVSEQHHVEVCVVEQGQKLPKFQEQKTAVSVATESVSRSHPHGKLARQGPLRSGNNAKSTDKRGSLLSLIVTERTAPAVDPVLAVKPIALKKNPVKRKQTMPSSAYPLSSVIGSSSSDNNEQTNALLCDLTSEMDLRSSSDEPVDREPELCITGISDGERSCASNDKLKEDDIIAPAPVSTTPTTPRRQMAFSESSLRNALTAARQVLMADEKTSDAPFVANEGEIDTPKKRMVPVPPTQQAHASKSPGMSNRRVERQFHSVV